MDFRAVHALQAREAFIRALRDAGFIESTCTFAHLHTPPAFALRDAEAASPRYAAELRAFTATWGLDAPWFRELCHDAVWGYCYSRPRRRYGHTLSAPFAGLEVIVAGADKARSAFARELGRIGLALWIFETRARVLPRLRGELTALSRDVVQFGSSSDGAAQAVHATLRFALFDGSVERAVRTEAFRFPLDHGRVSKQFTEAFERLWLEAIEPLRRRAGAPERVRELDRADSYARIFVAAAVARREAAASSALTSRTVETLSERWPEERLGSDPEEQAKKAVTTFRRLLRAPVGPP